MSELIEIQDGSRRSGQLWQPVVGEETLHLLRSKGFEAAPGNLNQAGERILNTTYRIMQSCCSPNAEPRTETGIVIGYVQSGKTLSFTLLTAMARDNNFQMVIVIAGTSVNLVEQSTARLKKDLGLDARRDRKWALISNPTDANAHIIETSLQQWADPTFPNDRCKTILITVMKNGSHLRNLTSMLNSISMTNVPTLIIDDEGDQASLNTRAAHASSQSIAVEDMMSEGEVSTIYRRLTDLRALFPLHTFLQYTATPQANLFINIMDRLSPNFIKLLQPGAEYTGGLQFFGEGAQLVKPIPVTDLPSPGVPALEPPVSFLKALRLFYLGVAAGEIIGDQHNRTMLVHPSRLQEGHSAYYHWANAITASWKRILQGNDSDDKRDLLAEFRVDYNDLQVSVGDTLPDFHTLTGPSLVHAIQYTLIEVVNARRGKTPNISWQDAYSWILVGGQSMDRGFTVEGLTVTYMPRDLGMANVDTILQRARFFGYKRGYLGYCRVFLPQDTINAFKAIVEHEEDVRERLLPFDLENKSLNEWEREAVLDEMLNLTRPNVLYDSVDRDQFGEGWKRMNAPHDTENLIPLNLSAIQTFIANHSGRFSANPGDMRRTSIQHQMMAALPLEECLRELLNKLRFTRDSDSATYSSLRGIFHQYLREHPDEQCMVYLMSATSIDNWETRRRSLDKRDQILNLFQGQNPKNGGGDIIYPGDANIKNHDVVSIQLHLLDIKDTDYTNVPTVAIWVPDRMKRDIIRQTP